MPVIEAGRIRLRPTSEGDLDFVLSTEQHEDNRSFVGQWSREEHRAAFSDRNFFHLLIETLPDQRPVGYVILQDVESADRAIQLRRIVVTEKGRGLGREAVRAVRQFVLGQLHAATLWLDVRADNTRARHVYEAEGFVLEGSSLEHTPPRHDLASHVVMAVKKPATR